MIKKVVVMIPLKFGLFWSGSKMSYLRYLTFLTLRHHHKDAEIELYISNRSKKDGFIWRDEEQDFQTYNGDCYLDKLKELNVKIIKAGLLIILLLIFNLIYLDGGG